MNGIMSENWELKQEDIYFLFQSKDNNYLCLSYAVRNNYPMHLMRSLFVRDMNMIEGDIKKYKWCPVFADESRDNFKLFLHFGGILCQDIIDRGESLDTYCPNWKNQLEQIYLDLRTERIYKTTMNPKYFFIDKNKVLKMFGFFRAYTYGEQPVSTDLIMPTFSKEELHLIRGQGMIDFKIFEELTFKNSKWPDDALMEICNKHSTDAEQTHNPRI